MEFILIFGPQAVGKMTVGLQLSKRLGYKLFHNHVSIDFLTPHFEFGTPSFSRLCEYLRTEFIREACESKYPGVIGTVVWALNVPSDRVQVDRWSDIVAEHGGKTYFVELAAGLDVRRGRNKTESRNLHKPQVVPITEATLESWNGGYVLNSNGDFFYPDNHLKIDNTDLSPEIVAEMTIEHFGLGKGK